MPPSGRTTIAVGSHSGYGDTAAVAEIVACGTAGAGADVVVISVDTITDERWAQWDDADAITFGAATDTDTASAPFHTADLTAAEHPGARVAHQAAIFHAGRATLTA
ncbi:MULTISPECIES: hypothetical protein [unclassified Streptomyces]|uniref:hypothetical protein n=1 Tax=unclassified Streptomyces TaxID=2593676 RepID=UPI00070DC9FB|nr:MULTISPECIES: hypothetical protein [unclassified Streptomyces]KRD09298.1 hypothetical protein ASE41_30285 [Streptomyces sp. Root264]